MITESTQIIGGLLNIFICKLLMEDLNGQNIVTQHISVITMLFFVLEMRKNNEHLTRFVNY